MLFLVTKSAIQLPFSRYVDHREHKVRWLIVGSFIIAAVPLLYILARRVTIIYLAQILYGIGSGLAYPTWLGLGNANLDKRQESFEWSPYSTLTGFGTAATAVVGAAIAQFIGFTSTFVLVGIMALAGCLVLFALEEQAARKARRG